MIPRTCQKNQVTLANLDLEILALIRDNGLYSEEGP